MGWGQALHRVGHWFPLVPGGARSLAPTAATMWPVWGFPLPACSVRIQHLARCPALLPRSSSLPSRPGLAPTHTFTRGPSPGGLPGLDEPPSGRCCLCSQRFSRGKR